LTTCLKYCVPIVSAMLAGAMLWTYFLPGGFIAEARRSFTVIDRPESRPRPWRQDASEHLEKPEADMASHNLVGQGEATQ